jgi:glycosyltransferase involved in cell wall biosynthesis
MQPIIQIGPLSDDPTESVSAVNRALISGLGDCYTFVASKSNRRHGATRQSRVNLWNLYYFTSHIWVWMLNLIRHRPAVAHYAVSSGWALEKGLIFLWLARVIGAKTVGHLHSGGFIDHWNRLSRRRKRFAGRQLAKLDAFVVLSESWRAGILEQGIVPRDKIFVVNNTIDPEFEAAALQMGVRPGAVVMLSLGVMGRDKGVLDLVEAVRMVAIQRQDFLLRIVGPEREPGILAQVRSLIKEYSLESLIEVGPSVAGTAKLDEFRRASIFILPSYYENFPLVVLEAAAAGHAIISTPSGATPEFFTHDTSALFVDPGRPQGLAQAILHLLGDRAERLRLGGAAREVIWRRLGRDCIMGSMDQVYRLVLSRT